MEVGFQLANSPLATRFIVLNSMGLNYHYDVELASQIIKPVSVWDSLTASTSSALQSPLARRSDESA